jgi:hypothetical protein
MARHAAAVRPSRDASSQLNAAAADSSEQESRVDALLGLLSSHLSELVSSVCPLAAAAGGAAVQQSADGDAAGADSSDMVPAMGVAAAPPKAAASRVRQSLQELTAVCKPRIHEVGAGITAVFNVLRRIGMYICYGIRCLDSSGGPHQYQLLNCVRAVRLQVASVLLEAIEIVLHMLILTAHTSTCIVCCLQVPELGNILSSLELLADWQQQQHSTHLSASLTTAGCQVSTEQPLSEPLSPIYAATAAGAAAGAASAQRDGLTAAAVQGEVSGIPKASFVPSELHRQLEEERQLNAQLSEQVRLLQQQLVKAGAVVSKSCSSLQGTRGRGGKVRLHAAAPVDMCSSMDSVLRGSTVAYQASASYDNADTAAAAAEQPLVRLHIQVNAAADAAGSSLQQLQQQQQQPGDLSAEGSSSSVAAAMDDADPLSSTRLMALQQQVASLQEQLEVVTRDKTSLQGRLTHARSVLAAARCSTPSSLCSSRLPSPQPCFSPLRPLYGVSAATWRNQQ